MLIMICLFFYSYESDDNEIDTSDYPPPGKLRATKSIGELCDALTSNSSLSPRYKILL